jgi:hypothetical protein
MPGLGDFRPVRRDGFDDARHATPSGEVSNDEEAFEREAGRRSDDRGFGSAGLA